MRKRLHTREDSGLVLDRDGRWFHDGEPVEHPRIAEAFNRGLQRAGDGRYVLRVGQDWCWVTVEDAPLQVTSAAFEGDRVLLHLSNGVREPLQPESLSAREGRLYCVSAAGLPARFSRSAQTGLGERLEERPGGFGLRLGGRVWPIHDGSPPAAAGPRCQQDEAAPEGVDGLDQARGTVG